MAMPVILIALITAWYASASLRGRIAARVDIAHGHYQVLGYGLPTVTRPEYSRLLHERYGIEYKAVAGCIVSTSLVSYVRGYNAVSTAAADRKFGHDVFMECSQDAERDFRAAAENLPKALFPIAPPKTTTIECFRSFGHDTVMEAVVRKCGRPDEGLGKTAYLFSYHLANGSTVLVRISQSDAVADIDSTDSSGRGSIILR